MRTQLAALLIAGSCFAVPATAHDVTAGDLHIAHPWSRAMPPTAATGAAYMTIANQGEKSDRLTAASTPVAGHTELHEHIHRDGLMKMQQIDSITLAPGQSVEFVPGGYHIMLFGLRQPLVAGDEYPMILTFEQAGAVEVRVQVQHDAPLVRHAAEGEHDQHGHHHH